MSAQKLEGCRRGLPEQLAEGERESLAERSLNLASGCQKERSYSHNVSKNELLKEFLALLVARAERCMVRAELCRNEMQRKAWLKEADCAELKVCSFLCREADPMARCSLLEQRSDYSPGTS